MLYQTERDRKTKQEKLKKGEKKLRNLGRNKLKTVNFNSTECKTKPAKGQAEKKARQGEQRTHFRRPGLKWRVQRAQQCKYLIKNIRTIFAYFLGKAVW